MSTASNVKEHIQRLPLGEPFTASDFSALGSRSAIERTLSRMADAEEIVRASRGVYFCPETTKFGVLPPSSLKIALVKAKGDIVQMHGADALRAFGLSTQHPVHHIYYTTGPSRRFTVAGKPVVMKHVTARKMVLPGTKAGLAITAMWYLGKKKLTKKAISTIKQHLAEDDYRELLANVDKMPAWMSDALHGFEGRASHG